MEIQSLLRLYYNDRLWSEGQPEFDELTQQRKEYIMRTICFEMFCKSERAMELEFELMAILN